MVIVAPASDARPSAILRCGHEALRHVTFCGGPQGVRHGTFFFFGKFCPDIDVHQLAPPIYRANDISDHTSSSPTRGPLLTLGRSRAQTRCSADPMKALHCAQAIHGTDSHDCRVRKTFPSFAPPVLNAPTFASILQRRHHRLVACSPWALRLILRSTYPCASPTIDDSTTLSEVLILADKCDIEAA